MRFGLHLTSSHTVEQGLALARRAEELGFDDVTFHDAILARPPWPVLMRYADATESVRLGPSVCNPFVQHPGVIAANAAHLDEASDGRALVGLGQGSHFDLLGLDPDRRLAGVEDAVHIIRHLCSGDEGPWQGSVFSLGANAALRFGKRRIIPIHLGAFGPRSTRLAGRLADGVRPAGQWDPSYALRMRAWVHEGAAQADRDPDEVDFVVQNWTCLHPDGDRARATARRILARRLPGLTPMIDFYGIAEEEVAAARAAARGDTSALAAIKDSTVDRFMAVGDATDLRSGLDRIAEAGFTAVSFSGTLGPDSSAAREIIGEEIARRRDTSGGRLSS